jgi:type I restriction enzyme S subunit
LHVQLEIATTLGALDDRITLLRETNATLEAIAQALFKSWFVDFDPVRAKLEGRVPEGIDEATARLFPDSFEESELGLVPRGWQIDSVYTVSTLIYGAPFASKQFNSNHDGKPLIRIRDLRDEAPGVFTPEVHPKGYMVQPEDIVVGMDGEFRAYLWGGEPAWLNQRVCVFAPKAGYPAAFVHRSIMPLLAAVEASETATTVIHLGKNDIDRFKILVPDERVLAAFGKLTDGLYSKIVNSKQSARTLATLRDTLLPRLISGQLRLPDEHQTTMDTL